MKNKLKFLVLALILPCAFLLTACGGGNNPIKVDIGDRTKYVQEEGGYEAFKQYSDAALASNDFVAKGIQATIVLDSEYASGTVKVEFVEEEVTAQTEVAGPETVTKLHATVDLTVEEVKLNAELYYEDGVIYLNLKKDVNYKVGDQTVTLLEKGKYFLNLEEVFEFAQGMMNNQQGEGEGMFDNIQGMVTESLEYFDFDGLYNMALGFLEEYGPKVKSYENGEKKYYEFDLYETFENEGEVVEGEEVETEEVQVAEVFITFNNGLFESVYVETEVEGEVGLKLGVELFNKNIEYPSFESYETNLLTVISQLMGGGVA